MYQKKLSFKEKIIERMKNATILKRKKNINTTQERRKLETTMIEWEL